MINQGQPSRILRTRRGFTLLELLIVIAIIGILSSILVLSLSRARQKARDTRRIADIEQLQRVLELYASDHQAEHPREYPPSQHIFECSIVDGEGDLDDCNGTDENNLWIPGLVAGGYASALPNDPRGFPDYEPYQYQRNTQYGYILSFKKEVGSQDNECALPAIPGHGPLSTRCGRMTQ